MYEAVQGKERRESDHRKMEGLPGPPAPPGGARWTQTAMDKFSIVPGSAVTCSWWAKDQDFTEHHRFQVIAVTNYNMQNLPQILIMLR